MSSSLSTLPDIIQSVADDISAPPLAPSTPLYRYRIQTADDLSLQTFQRRQRKKEKSLSSGFLFDLTLAKHLEGALDFLAQTAQATDQILICGSQKPIQINNLICNILVRSGDHLPSDEMIFKNSRFIFSPRTQKHLIELSESKIFKTFTNVYWLFENYDPGLKKSLTIQQIGQFLKDFPQIKRAHGFIPLWSSHISEHHELEPLVSVAWETRTAQADIQISVIIPTFNNCLFLTNVIHHLLKQKASANNYEIIVVDDGSTDQSSQAIKSLLSEFNSLCNFKYIYWTKAPENRPSQNFFRAGLARNLGVEHSQGPQLLFLDSDMLVPEDFIDTCLDSLKTVDIIQFQRYHLNQKDSLNNPSLKAIDIKNCYIEEKNYWSQLFFTENWMSLSNHWKYTCTYALGMKRQDFFSCGRFKRHYTSYGFEDTDIGYRMYLQGKKFHLIQKPLFHLTSYNQQQYRNSRFLRDQLLRKTSRLFFLDHLSSEVFSTFHFYYRFEKPFFRTLKDLF